MGALTYEFGGMIQFPALSNFCMGWLVSQAAVCPVLTQGSRLLFITLRFSFKVVKKPSGKRKMEFTWFLIQLVPCYLYPHLISDNSSDIECKSREAGKSRKAYRNPSRTKSVPMRTKHTFILWARAFLLFTPVLKPTLFLPKASLLTVTWERGILYS